MSRRVLVLVAVGVSLAVVGAVVALGTGGDGDGGNDDGVILLAATAPGPDDFAEDLDPAADRAVAPSADGEVEGIEPLDDAVALAARSARGNAARLYAGTRGEGDCDVDRLAELVTGADADPALAEAWFGALGLHIEERERSGYLDGLTPARLRLDTRVTGHGYRDGAATGYAAVLQAGTAVLVDGRGVPRARCTGAAPLSGPEPSEGTAGEAALDVDALAANPDDAWDGFDPAAVVVVRDGTLADGVELADVAGGEAFTRPLGSDGFQDRQVISPDGPARPADPCDEERCHALEITVEAVGGTPATVSWAGVGTPTARTEASLTWAEGEAAPGDYRYDVGHDWITYRVLGPDDPRDPTTYDDPAYADEVLLLDTSTGPGALEPPRMMECAPGDVVITVTVDGTVVESTTEPVSCTGLERTFTLG